MSLSTALAKALFDNAAESPEELAFRKGDILMVLEQERGGWWLCSLHGRQGIAPANRLRLLNTSQPCPDTLAQPPHGEDPGEGVYLSPGPQLRPAGLDPGEGVYLSPSGSRPRSRSSSGSRPPRDWDTGRARSPSLRGRGAEDTSPKQVALYQTPRAPETVCLAPGGVPRAAAEGLSLETAYLVPREVVGMSSSEGCYLIPRACVMASEDVYQTPTGSTGVADTSQGPRRNNSLPPLPSGTPLVTQPRLGQEAPGLYQTPTLVGGLPRTPKNDRRESASASGVPVSALGSHRLVTSPAQGSPRPQPKVLPKPPVHGGKLAQALVKNSPILPRATQARAQGSPSAARKPPPPPPPVRGVSRKESPLTPQPGAREEGQRDGGMKEGNEKKNLKTKKDEEEGEYEDPDDENLHNQVYDTPPTSRWKDAVPVAVSEDDDCIYNTPRTLPPQTDHGSEVYDVPTLTLPMTSDLQQPTCTIPACVAVAVEAEEDVYSVPTLPGLSAASNDVPDGPGLEAEKTEVYSMPGPGRRAVPGPADAAPPSDGLGDGSEPTCGIYDMPSLTLDLPPCSSRRSSASSASSGDGQWRAALSALVQTALGSTSRTTPPREMAASLTEILSVWKASQGADTTQPLLQAWSHLSDLLPALAACGSAPPSEALLSLVRRALEDTASLLQSQALPLTGRPRLPSQDSLSRRPLPALPVAEVKPLNVGMGSRKGSWIQERPLPPPPPPAFPLPPAPPPLPVNDGVGEEDSGNEYAGIGLTVAPPPVPTGDSVGYVKLQGKPEPLPVIQTETGPTTEHRSSPSPPLPGSLTLEESELLSFYSSQSLSHLSCLADSIDALFSSVQGNQPPRVFVSRGKSLIVTAHKLVFIGDTLSRLLTSPDLRAKVTTSGGRLCQALKAVVVATKGAAQNYPSVPATQEMVDRVAELSQHAAGFSGLLQRLADMS